MAPAKRASKILTKSNFNLCDIKNRNKNSFNEEIYIKKKIKNLCRAFVI
jgi:hypothetical protein